MSEPHENADLVTQLYTYVHTTNACILAIGLVGNITAFVVLSTSRSFHTLTGFYLLSLTTADILILMTSHFYYHHFWLTTAGLTAFHIFIWLLETCSTASTLTVTAFTVERYLAICHPFFIQSKSKKSRVKKIIIAIWIVSGLITAPLVAILTNEYWEKKIEHYMVYIAIVWATLWFFTPMSAMTVMYLLIWIKLKNSSNERTSSTRRTERADTRTLMMFVVIITVFFLAWGPYYAYRIFCTHMTASQSGRIKDLTFDLDVTLDAVLIFNLVQQVTYPLSSVLNPIIYSLMSRQFREALKDLFLQTNRRVSTWSTKLMISSSRRSTAETSAETTF